MPHGNMRSKSTSFDECDGLCAVIEPSQGIAKRVQIVIVVFCTFGGDICLDLNRVC